MHFFSEQSLNTYKEAHHDKQLILYKHNRASEGSLKIIEDETIKYTSPAEFNDPNDCSFELKINFDSCTKEDAESILGEHIPDTDWPDFFPIFKLSYEPTFLKKMETIKNYFGVSCFNNAPLETLMWAHYAQDHKGFVTEFNFSTEDEYLDIPLVVEYSDSFPSIEIPCTDPSTWVNIDVHDVVNKAFCSKAKNWTYEKEFRLIKDNYDIKNASSQLKKFNPRMLNSIILGVKIEDEYEKKIRFAVQKFNERNSTNVPIYKASYIKNTHSLTISNHPFLDLAR